MNLGLVDSFIQLITQKPCRQFTYKDLRILTPLELVNVIIKIIMSVIRKVLISTLLIFLLVFTTLADATASCHCCEMRQTDHSCCPEENNSSGLLSSRTEIKGHQSCHCAVKESTNSNLTEMDKQSYEIQQDFLSSIDISTQNALQSIGIKPIWLHQIYYPDRSSLYLRIARLLI